MKTANKTPIALTETASNIQRIGFDNRPCRQNGEVWNLLQSGANAVSSLIVSRHLQKEKNAKQNRPTV